jgi:hypothetical protein
MVARGHIGPRWRADLTPSGFEKFPPDLAPGVYATLHFRDERQLAASEVGDLRSLSRGITVYVIGRVTYDDDLGISRPAFAGNGPCHNMPNTPGSIGLTIPIGNMRIEKAAHRDARARPAPGGRLMGSEAEQRLRQVFA